MPEYHLRVYADRSELFEDDDSPVVFFEGAADGAATQRHEAIKEALEDGFLVKEIELCKNRPDLISFDDLSDAQRENIAALVASMTSEVGRAIIGLSVLQLTVKSICPEQNVRLHKSGNRAAFGWRDGIPMRPLDASYITPALRKHELLKLNSFGFMMTRTLAENYPYTKVYKAGIRGGRGHWLQIVEGIEDGSLHPRVALRFLLSQLINSAAEFKSLSERVLKLSADSINKGSFDRRSEAVSLFERHMKSSQYAARIMEISMHSLMQSMEELNGLGFGKLERLSQMRSANKKHGNIGDIEIFEGTAITHSWDAKYGKSYLRDEIEELLDKLESHPSVRHVGFVTSGVPDLSHEITSRIQEISESSGITITIESFTSWVDNRVNHALNLGIAEDNLVRRWVLAYVESLAQLRPDIAPIDEPCFQWVESLEGLI